MASNFNIETILIAPLDWGLGHATRCIPIIKALQNKYNVIIAAEGKQQFLLQQQFPTANFIFLKGYRVQYSKKKSWLPVKMLLQMPKIISSIQHEKRWLNKIIDDYNIDLVISDNRYGLHSKKVPTIFITHQLTIKISPNWLQQLVQQINYTYINKFSACWVPDVAGDKNIAHILSHPTNKPKVPVHYIGVLSRFKKSAPQNILYKYCILLSGPEPQRSLLEEKILQVMKVEAAAILLIRGMPGSNDTIVASQNVTVVNHLPEMQLQQAIEQSEYVISRSGYTTVMEMFALQKKTIYIPTPGQTEQEYLADELMQQGWCYAVEQNNFSKASLINATAFNYSFPQFDDECLPELIPQLIEGLKQ